MERKILVLLLLVLLAFQIGYSETPAEEVVLDTIGPPALTPPSNVRAMDKLNDTGHGIIVNWDPSPDDGAGLDNVLGYEVYRSDTPDGEYMFSGMAIKGSSEFEDKNDTPKMNGDPNPEFIETGKTYYFKVRSMASGNVYSEFTEPVSGFAVENWYHQGKTGILVGVLIFWAFVVYFIFKARRGKEFYRPSAGRYQRCRRRHWPRYGDGSSYSFRPRNRHCR